MKWLVIPLFSALSSVPLSSSLLASSPGQAVWTSKRVMLKDSLGRYFYQPLYPDYTLARVNQADGKIIWSKTLPEFAYFDTNCSEGDRIYIYSGKKLEAINPENGQTLWAYTHEGNESYTNLSCLPRSNEVFIGYGENSSSVKAINKLNGQKKWEYSAGAYAYIFNSDWQNYYISQYTDGVGKIIALNPWNGSHHWTRSIPNGAFWTVDSNGRVYITGGSAQIQKLAPWDGSIQWTYQGADDYAFLNFTDDQTLYVQDREKIVRLNPDNGSALWSYGIANPPNGYTYPYLLKSGHVVVRTSYTDDNKSKNVFLNRDDGSKRWENWTESAAGYIAEDDAQNIYTIESKRIIAYQQNDGKARWTYNFQGDAILSIFQIFGRNNGLYATYGNPGKYPPMGIIRLNGADGSELWRNFIAKPFSVLGVDDQRVYLSGYLSGESWALQP